MALLLLPLKHHLNLLKKARVKKRRTVITGRNRKSLGSFVKQAAAAEVSISVSYTVIEAELSSYLLGQLADSESNPLTWWKVHENSPVIGSLAKKYLCIPATSTASERVLSAGGNAVTCQRSLLKPATVNMLVFVTKNLKV